MTMTQVLVLPIPSMAGHRLPSLRPLPAPSSGTESLFQCETTACPAQNQPTTFPRFHCKPGPPGDTLLTNGHAERKSAKQDRLAWPGTSPAFPSLPAQSTDVRALSPAPSCDHERTVAPRSTGAGQGPRSLPTPWGWPQPWAALPLDFCSHERRQ